MFIYALPLCYNGDIMEKEYLYGEKYLDKENVDVLIDIAYIRGLQDMKDAILLFCQEIYDKNMKASKIWEALDEFLKSIDRDILVYKEAIMKIKFPETWISNIPKIKEKITTNH